MKPFAQKSLLCVSALFASVVFSSLALGDVVFNGSNSLPHNAYFMYRTKVILPRGAYVHFPAPASVSDGFKDLAFVKRVVGVPGDQITTSGHRVCIRTDCRDLLPVMVDRGFAPLLSGAIPPDHVAVFGDADNSLDSRYATIGLIPIASISAVGFPVPLPNWKEVRTWAVD